ncbi:unnamed protein product, partial [Owenia fusiformis]
PGCYTTNLIAYMYLTFVKIECHEYEQLLKPYNLLGQEVKNTCLGKRYRDSLGADLVFTLLLEYYVERNKVPLSQLPVQSSCSKTGSKINLTKVTTGSLIFALNLMHYDFVLREATLLSGNEKSNSPLNHMCTCVWMENQTRDESCRFCVQIDISSSDVHR